MIHVIVEIKIVLNLVFWIFLIASKAHEVS